MNLASRPVQIALALFVFLVSGLAGAAFYLRYYPVDLSYLRDDIAAELQVATGRKVTITGQIKLGVSLTPALDVSGLQVANNSWGHAKNVASVGNTKIRVRLIPLLQGRTEIVSISADHAEVHLESDGRKRRNWNIIAQAAEADGDVVELPVIKEITVNDIVLDYRQLGDAAPQHRLHLEQFSLVADDVNGIGHFSIKGKLGDHPVKMDGKVAPLNTVHIEQPRQFDLKGEIFDLHLSADGSVKFPFKEFTYADFNLDAPKGLSTAAAYFGIALPDLGDAKISGNLTPFEDVLRFGSMTIRLGDSHATGSVEITPGRTMRVTTDLHSKILNFDTYWAMLPSSPPPPPGKIFATDAFQMRFPEGIEAQLYYAADWLDFDGQKYSDLKVDAQLKPAILRINAFNVKLADGVISSRALITPKGDALVVSAHAFANGVDLEKLFKQFDLPKYARGKAAMLFQGEATGETVAALAANLQGRAFFEIQEGAIPKRLSSMLSGSVMHVFRSIEGMFSGEGKDAKLECGLGAFMITEGIVQTKTMLLQTDKAVVTVKGNIDLGEERLAMQISPRPRDVSLINLASDVDVKGPLTAPYFNLNKASVARKLGTTALGLALGPLGLIVGSVANSAKSSAGNNAPGRCGGARAAALSALQTTTPWPELVGLGTETDKSDKSGK